MVVIAAGAVGEAGAVFRHTAICTSGTNKVVSTLIHQTTLTSESDKKYQEVFIEKLCKTKNSKTIF